MPSLTQMVDELAHLADDIKTHSSSCFSEAKGWKSAEDEEKYMRLNQAYDDCKRAVENKRKSTEILDRLESLDLADDTPAPGRPRKVRNLSPITSAVAGWMLCNEGKQPKDDHIDAAEECGINLRAPYIDVPFGRDLVERQHNGLDVHLSLRRRVMNEMTTTQPGDVTIPAETLSRRLEVALLASGHMMQTSEIMRTSSGEPFRMGTMDNTMNKAEIIGEAQDATASGNYDPSFSDMTLTAYKYRSWIKISQELLEDSVYNMAAIIGDSMGEQFGRALNEHFTVGTGTGQPTGIIQDTVLGKTAGSASAIVGDDIIDLVHSVDPLYRPGARFSMHDSTIAHIRKLKLADDQYIWQPGLQQGVPDRLYGYPVEFNQDMPQVGSSNIVALFGQLSSYKVRLVNALRFYRLEERYREFDTTGFIAYLRADGRLLDAGTNPVKHLQMGV